MTVSIGVAERQAEQRTPEEVLKSADQALYAAKALGVTAWLRPGKPDVAQCAWRALPVE